MLEQTRATRAEPLEQEKALTSDALELLPATVRLSPGEQIGRYSILGRLGEGGMSIVYAAHDPELDRKVAMKFLRSSAVELRQDSQGHIRLLREAQAIAKLSHPNVVTIYEVGSFERQVYLVMELMEGLTLTQWRREHPRSWQEVVGVFVQAGRGLAAAHAAGFVHRDFKPDNVLIGSDGRVRVLDFGLARATHDPDSQPPTEGRSADPTPSTYLGTEVTQAGVVVGTPAYMAPEQHLGLVATTAADQFAYCVALYESLFGVRPFHGKSRQQLAAAKRTLQIQLPQERVRVPKWLRQAVQRGLEPDPAARHPSMEALLQILSRDPTRERRWIALGVGGLLLVGASATAVSAMYGLDGHACETPTARFDGVWDEQARETIHTAFAATGVGYAEDSWARVERGVDDFIDAWQTQHVDACEATWKRHEQSERLLDLRMQCLDRQSAQLEALVGIFARANEKIVRNAVGGVLSLPDPSACAQTEMLMAEFDPGRDLAANPELQNRLARIKASITSGEYDTALAQGETLIEDCHRTQDEVTLSETLYELGNLHDSMGASHRGESLLFESTVIAESIGLHRVVADARASLVHVIGYKQERFDEGDRWARLAQVALERVPEGRSIESKLLSNRGHVRIARGDYEGALALFERSLSLREHSTPSHRATHSANVGLAYYELSEYVAAERAFRKTLALHQEVYGPTHPHVALAHSNLGNVLHYLGRYDEAIAEHQAALEIRQAAFGSDHESVASSLNNYGNVLADLGRFEEAEKFHTNALQIRRARENPSKVAVAQSQHNLAIAMHGQGRYAEAAPQFEQAIATLATLEGRSRLNLASYRANLAETFLALERYADASAQVEAALAIYEETVPDHMGVGLALRLRASILAAQDRIDEALADLERAMKIVGERSRHHPRLADFGRFRAELLRKKGEHDLAMRAYEEALSVVEQGERRPKARAALLVDLARLVADLDGKEGGRARELVEQARLELQTLDDPASSLAADLAELERRLHHEGER